MLMPNLPFTLRQLDVFTALCETMSFRRCAEELHVSQASVSNQIKALETQLGVRLFERPSGRSPALTDEGLAFLSDLKDFERAAQRLAAHRKQSPLADERTNFRILIGAGLMERYIKPKLEQFIAAKPSIECDFVPQHPTMTPIKAIEEGQFDFALYHIKDEVELPEGHEKLAQIDTGIIGHERLVGGRDLPLSALEVSNLPIILPPKGGDICKRLLATLGAMGVTPRNVVGHTQYHEVMARMIARGDAAGALPIAILEREVRSKISVLFHVASWQLVWHRRPGTSGETASALERFIKSAVLEDSDFVDSVSIGHPGVETWSSELVSP